MINKRIEMARENLRGEMEELVGKVQKIADGREIKVNQAIIKQLQKARKMDNFDKVISYKAAAQVMINNLKGYIDQSSSLPGIDKDMLKLSLDKLSTDLGQIFNKFQLVF